MAPMGCSENWLIRESTCGEPGFRNFMSLRLPLKFSRSVLRSSKFRSDPPLPKLNRADEPARTKGENFNLPSHQGVSNVPENATRCRRSCKFRANSLLKSPSISALEVLFNPSSLVLDNVYAIRKFAPNPWPSLRYRLRSSRINP